MENPTDVIVFIHGMTPKIDSFDWSSVYNAFWKKLCQSEPELNSRALQKVFIQWGHPRSASENIDGTAAIQMAQKNISELLYPPTSNFFAKIMKTIKGLGLVSRTKEKEYLLGLSDVIYATSHLGSIAVLKEIESQFSNIAREGSQRVHFITHSFGVTLGFELLTKFQEPGVWENCILGSFTSMASQLPITLFKRPEWAHLFCDRNFKLSLSKYVKNQTSCIWNNFYDFHDILGYPNQPLFLEDKWVIDYKVNTGFLPIPAHEKYWVNKQVIQKTAQLLAFRTKPVH